MHLVVALRHTNGNIMVLFLPDRPHVSGDDPYKIEAFSQLLSDFGDLFRR